MSANSWAFLAVSYDKTTVRLYVNGTQVATLAATANIATSANPLQIGGDSLYGQYFAGLIDNVRVYNTALTAAQIQTDMNTPISTVPDTTPPGKPGTLTATAVSATEVDLGWGAASDNVGVSGYHIERCQGSSCVNFAEIGTTSGTGTTYRDLTTTAGTSYRYQVRAGDAAGNLGPYSDPATATTPAATGPSPVAAYAFDEGSGSVVADSSGSGNNGTVANTVWSAGGKYGGALSFNGSSSLVTIPNAASLQLTTGMTLEAWVDPSVVNASWRDVIYKGDDNYYLEGTSNNGSRPGAGGTFASSVVFGTSALSANSWAFLAVSYDKTTVRLYVNGTQVATLAATANIATSANPLQIGGDSLYGQYFAGLIDNVRVYNTALTAAQIQTDMNTPISTVPDTTPPGKPGTLTATAVSATEVDLGWGAASDNVGVSGYHIERCQGSSCVNFAEIGTTSGTGTTYKDLTTTAGTSYRYQVRAGDAAGNLGPYSDPATATTPAATGPSPVAAYAFDEGSGSVVADSSGSGNNGTVANTVWSAGGKYGGALSFNGSSSW